MIDFDEIAAKVAQRERERLREQMITWVSSDRMETVTLCLTEKRAHKLMAGNLIKDTAVIIERQGVVRRVIKVLGCVIRGWFVVVQWREAVPKDYADLMPELEREGE